MKIIPQIGVGCDKTRKSDPEILGRRELGTISLDHFFEIFMFRLIFWDHKLG